MVLKMNKLNKIFLICMGVLFLSIFFFKLIPVPVENIEGAGNPDKFIYGGLYWTSLYYETSVKNYIPLVFTPIIFGCLFLIKKQFD